MTHTTLSNVLVRDAMRRQRIDLPRDASISVGIRTLIKYKVSALLNTDENRRPVGVVSKTDIMGAYYAGLPIAAPLAEIMSSPPLFCRPADSLEVALQTMRSRKVYRLFVREDPQAEVAGTLAYPDIVGLLYRFCHGCKYRKHKGQADDPILRYSVKEVMTTAVQSVARKDTLNRVMEELSAYHFGALLITDSGRRPCGVISKTDLVLAYRHGIDPRVTAESVMSSPLHTCGEDQLLEDAIRCMILADIHRLFVHRQTPAHIVGVLSLTDAARTRSGSCHACISSRITVRDADGSEWF